MAKTGNRRKDAGTRIRFEDDHIKVRNVFCYWLEDVVVETKIHGTRYIVDAIYEGMETLPKKLQRILANEEKSDSDG